MGVGIYGNQELDIDVNTLKIIRYYYIMDKLTLDTNVLRDWAWVEDISFEKRYSDDLNEKKKLINLFVELRKIRDSGNCEIGITNQIYTDYEKDVSELPKFIEEMIGSHVNYALPSVSTFPMIFPFVFADESEIDSILLDVFPNTKPEHKKYKHNKKDALQLYAHTVAGRDFFLTSDKSILAAKDILSSRWNISVITLHEYIEITKK